MTDTIILSRLRRFLLLFALVILVGALVELWFSEHTQETLQFIPFFLSGLGIVGILLAFINPQRRSIQFLQISMIIVLLGSLFGMGVHIVNNILFQEEIHPGLSFFEKISAGLGGANPLLAPGILGIAAVLALTAAYAHPARRSQVSK